MATKNGQTHAFPPLGMEKGATFLAGWKQEDITCSFVAPILALPLRFHAGLPRGDNTCTELKDVVISEELNVPVGFTFIDNYLRGPLNRWPKAANRAA
jgi:hypothetical protein